MIALQLSQLEKGAATGLCLEFILHEYAKALAIAEPLVDAAADDRLKIFEKLCADSPCAKAIQQPGVLDKLCFYCEALVQTSKIGENLLDAIDGLRNAALLPRTILARLQRSIAHASSHRLSDLVHAFHDRLRAFFSLLVPIFEACLDCEAAFFTLLELRHTFDHFLGKGCVENLLQRLFPGGPDILRQMLANGYSRRGFGDFCKTFDPIFEGLTWSQPANLSAPKPSA